MKNIALLLLLGLTACSNNDSPTAPVVPICEREHTATITVTNVGLRTVDILWSGAVIATLPPGQVSSTRTVVAGGAQYLLDQVITNTNFHPCGTLVATPLQCRLNTYSTCSFQ